MIGRRIPIGLLAEMVGAFLDALEITYVLYDADDELRRLARLRPLAVPGAEHSVPRRRPSCGRKPERIKVKRMCFAAAHYVVAAAQNSA